MARFEMISFGRRILKSYTNLLKKYPVPMQSVQTGFLVGTGDVIAQTFVEKKEFKTIEWNRTLSYAGVGLVIGPTVGTWYRILDHFLGSGGIKIVFKKIAFDQLLFAPLFCVCVVSTFSAIRGQTLLEIQENLRNKYVDVLFTNYKIWPFVQLVNFYFVPLMYRVLLVQLVSIVWNTYLSWKINVVDVKLEEHKNL